MLCVQRLHGMDCFDDEMYDFFERWNEREPEHKNRAVFSIGFSEFRDFDGHPPDIQMFFQHDECRFLSEALSLVDIKEWHPNWPIFISSQTGSGKSTFIFDVLLRHVVDLQRCGDREANILLLSNRIALNRQMRMAVAKRIKGLLYGEQLALLEEMEKSDAVSLDAWSFRFPMITLSTYQSISKNASDLWNYRYLVSDEAHFFTSDSTFNAHTEDVMKYIIKNGRNAVRLYLSATPEIAFEPIIREEYHRFVREAGMDVPLNIFYYNMARDYSYVKKIFYFDTDDELLDVIRKSDEKWMIFVDSRDMGEFYKRELCKDKTCVFLSSDNKYHSEAKAVFDEIIEKEMFSVDVLVATSVLDNGINIKSSTVHNLVIEVFDKTEFVQMLGRIRRVENTELNLFIKVPNLIKLTRNLMEGKKSLAQRLMCDVVPTNGKEEIVVNNIIYTSMKRRYNRNAIYQLTDSIYRLQRMVDGMTQESSNNGTASSSWTNCSQTIYHHFYRNWDGVLKLPWRNDVCRIFSTPTFWEEDASENYLNYVSFDNLVLGELIPAALENSEKAAPFYELSIDASYHSPLEEMLRWIGKSTDECEVLPKALPEANAWQEYNYYLKFVATPKEIESHHSQFSNDSKVLEKEWLQAHGIRKDSQYEKFFLERYLPEEKNLRGNGKIVEIPHVGRFQIQSFRTSGDKTTYYLLVPIDESCESQGC